MASHLSTLAYLVKMTRKDGVILSVTDHDVDITYSGTTYKSTIGANASSVEVTSQLNVDNLEITGFLSLIGISEAQVAAGLWDFCAVQVRRVNWTDLTMGDDKVKAGWIGEISLGRDAYMSEIRGLTQKLHQTIGEVYSPSCKADLFDARCKLVATVGVWQFTGVAVTTVIGAQRNWTSSALTQVADFFTAGKVVWTSGANNGLSKEIKAHATSGNIFLQEPMPYVIAVGDTYTIFAGCQKRFTEDCVGKFDNRTSPGSLSYNHRGFPFLPGEDATLRGY